jgi:hypothetical protein
MAKCRQPGADFESAKENGDPEVAVLFLKRPA